MAKVSVFLNRLHFAECPRWHDECLYVSDMWDKKVYRVDAEGARHVVCHLTNDDPGGTGWLPDGTMLVVGMERKVIYRLKDGNPLPYADLSAIAPALCNDMAVSREGNAYVSHHGYDVRGGEEFRPTTLMMVRPSGAAEPVADDIYMPNGIAISGDGSKLAVAESMGGRISCFTIDNSGRLSDRQILAVAPRDGASMCSPDGLCFDESGRLWFADPLGHRIVRLNADGTVSDIVELDGFPLAVALGGKDRRTLYVCTVDQMFKRQRTDERTARVLAIDVDTPGAGVP